MNMSAMYSYDYRPGVPGTGRSDHDASIATAVRMNSPDIYRCEVEISNLAYREEGAE